MIELHLVAVIGIVAEKKFAGSINTCCNNLYKTNMTMVLGERDPTFVGMQRYEGNVAIVEHPTDPVSYGDGSIEISGSVHTDFIRSATPSTSITIKNPVVWQTLSTPPPPSSSGVKLYSDAENSGRIAMMDSTGTIIDLNPLKTVGDLMTFDGVKNTTVRLPAGFSEQKLVCDPNLNYATRLSWKSDQANVYQVSSTSDGYLRYCESTNSGGLSLTATPQQISLDNGLRVDDDAFSIAIGGAGGVIALQQGIYEVVYSVDVSFDPEATSGLSSGSIACVETYIENSDPSGYSVTLGSRNYCNITYIPDSNIESSNSIVTRCVLNLTASTRLRFYVSEYNTFTGALQVKPLHGHLSIIKLAWDDPNSQQHLIVQGIQGSRTAIGTDFTTIPTTAVIYQSNSNDTVGLDSITISTQGMRHLIVKTTFAAYNANIDLSATVATQVLINGTLPPLSTAKCALLSDNGIGTCVINCVQNVNVGDIISIQCTISSSNLSQGQIVIVSEQCTITVSMPNQTYWKRLCLRSNSLYSPNASQFSDLQFAVTEVGGIDTDEFQVTGAIEDLLVGGTYQYILSADFLNADTVPYTGMIRLVTDTGDGWKEIPGSVTLVTLGPGTSQTVFQCATVYVPPHSVLKCQILSPDGGDIQIVDNTGHIILSKYENTKAPFVGSLDFGRFWKYIYDDEEVLTTSTEFAVRLVAMTIDLPVGYYRVGVSFEWDMTDAGIGFETQMLLDNATTVDSFSTVPIITGAYSKVTSFQQLYLDAGEHTISFNTRVQDSSRALYTRNVRIEFWKF